MGINYRRIRRRDWPDRRQADRCPAARGLRGVWSAAAVIALCASAACTRRIYVPVERVTRDSVTNLRLRADTLIERDSVYIAISGDTVVREVYRWRTRTRTRTDTLYRTLRDTVPVVIAPTRERGDTPSWRTRLRQGLEAVKWTTRAIFIFLAARWAVRRLRALRRSQ